MAEGRRAWNKEDDLPVYLARPGTTDQVPRQKYGGMFCSVEGAYESKTINFDALSVGQRSSRSSRNVKNQNVPQETQSSTSSSSGGGGGDQDSVSVESGRGEGEGEETLQSPPGAEMANCSITATPAPNRQGFFERPDVIAYNLTNRQLSSK